MNHHISTNVISVKEVYQACLIILKFIEVI